MFGVFSEITHSYISVAFYEADFILFPSRKNVTSEWLAEVKAVHRSTLIFTVLTFKKPGSRPVFECFFPPTLELLFPRYNLLIYAISRLSLRIYNRICRSEHYKVSLKCKRVCLPIGSAKKKTSYQSMSAGLSRVVITSKTYSYLPVDWNASRPFPSSLSCLAAEKRLVMDKCVIPQTGRLKWRAARYR